MNWQEEVTKLIVAHFKSVGIIYAPKNDIYHSMVDFMNLEMKLIDSKPRQVLKSDTLQTKKIPLKYSKALKYIECKINRGNNITYHMSKKVLDPMYNDLLMNNWVIQHFHLSDTKTKKGQKFYDRSEYLLFAMFNENQAFLIDIQKHNEKNVFARQKLLEIVDRNWPHILRTHNHPDAEFLNNQYSDADLDVIRKKGYCILTTLVNGKVIINPGIGITTSGHNLHVIKRANEAVRYLYDSLQEVEKDKNAMKEALINETGIKIVDLDLQIHKLNKWPFFALYESNSKCYIEKNYQA